MSPKQQTLNAPITFQGKGLHTGLHVTMTVNPAEAGHGIKFRRIDLEAQPTIEALADFVVDTSRGTTIEKRGVRELAVYPDDEFSINVNIDFNSKIIGNQYARLDRIGDFAEQIAPCRTFVFLHELEPLIKNNLIKGGDLDNAIVIVENKIPDEELARLSELFNKKDVQVDEGYLNNIQLRFPNEPSRHKLLDMVGDLALIGMRIHGRVVAYRPGHAANTELAKIIRRNIKRDAAKPRFHFEPDSTPVYDYIARNDHRKTRRPRQHDRARYGGSVGLRRRQRPDRHRRSGNPDHGRLGAGIRRSHRANRTQRAGRGTQILFGE